MAVPMDVLAMITRLGADTEVVLLFGTNTIHVKCCPAISQQKMKGYSNPAGGHLTFISQQNLTNYMYNRNANYACVYWGYKLCYRFLRCRYIYWWVHCVVQVCVLHVHKHSCLVTTSQIIVTWFDILFYF